MNELITITDGIALLNPETTSMIAEFEKKAKEIEEKEKELRALILVEMESKGIKKIETEEFFITYKAPYDKESFQTKEFRAQNPDMYDEFVKITPCKASITIKLKEDKA